jgi:parvulin-like peptidyl-prolyl isomerase
VTEEVLYREALALGLDRDDLVVRRRMRQKMEFLNDGLAERGPSEEELRAFLEENPERFLFPSRVSFRQVFIRPEEDDAVEKHAARLLARLRTGADPETLGDPTLLPRSLRSATPREVAETFGARFAEALADTPEGVWSGPVESSFGAHLVRVSAREPGRLPALEEARGAVEREWAAERRAEARERFYDAVRGSYDVEVRMPPAASAAEVAERR